MSELNFLPEHLKRKRLKKDRLKRITILIFAILSFISIVFYIPFAVYENYQKEFKSLSNLKKNSSVETASIPSIPSKILIDSNQTAENKRIRNMINNIKVLTPPGLEIKSIMYEGGRFGISGRTKDFLLIIGFTGDIKRVQSESLRLNRIEFNRTSGFYNFIMEIRYQEGVK